MINLTKNVQIIRHENVQIIRHENVQIIRHKNAQIIRHKNVQIFRHKNIYWTAMFIKQTKLFTFFQFPDIYVPYICCWKFETTTKCFAHYSHLTCINFRLINRLINWTYYIINLTWIVYDYAKIWIKVLSSHTFSALEILHV